MKFLAAIVVFAVIAGAIAVIEIPIANITRFLDECIKSSNVSSNDVEMLRNRSIEVPEGGNHELKEFATCYFKKIYVIHDRVLDVERFANMVSVDSKTTKENIVTSATKCKEQSGNKEADVALNFYLCMNKSEV